PKIAAPKPFVRNWVANHYVARIERAFRAEGAEPVSLSIVMAATPPSIGGNAREPAELPASNVSYLPPRPENREDDGAKGLWTRMLHPQQTFDSFIPGPANEFGHGA